MKKMTLAAVMITVVLPCTAAFVPTDLPAGGMSSWTGKSHYGINLGNGQFIQGKVEFTVYDTQVVNPGIAVPGGRRYLYAYQIFNTGDYANAAVQYFTVLGINPDAIASTDDIGTAAVAGGINATDAYYNLSKTKAIFEFGETQGILLAGKKSYFLLLGSDAAPRKGTYTFQADSSDDVPTPGENDDTNNDQNQIPEPASVALLMVGTLAMLRKGKK